MINPGRTSPGSPTFSGTVSNGPLKTQLLAIDGFSVTVGLVLLLILIFLVYNTFYRRRRR